MYLLFIFICQNIFILQNFSFEINNSTITGVRENSRTDFCSSLHSLQVTGILLWISKK